MSAPRFFIGLLISVLVSPQAFSISRVGPCGIIDSLEGFEVLEVPEGFRDISAISNSGVVLNGTPKPFNGGVFAAGLAPVNQIRIYPLRYEYPELTGLSRDGYKLFLRARGARWIQLKVNEPSYLVMSTENAGLRTTVVGWGVNRGIVIISAVNKQTDAVILQLINSIRVNHKVNRW